MLVWISAVAKYTVKCVGRTRKVIRLSPLDGYDRRGMSAVRICPEPVD